MFNALIFLMIVIVIIVIDIINSLYKILKKQRYASLCMDLSPAQTEDH